MRPQIRRVDQDVKRLAPGGRSAGFGASGRREITGRVGRGFALLGGAATSFKVRMWAGFLLAFSLSLATTLVISRILGPDGKVVDDFECSPARGCSGS